MTLDEWKKKVKYRGYTHFDRRISLRSAWPYISDPQKVKEHGFYPFIRFTITITKYSKEKGKTRKTREVCYAAHMDRYIYQYYSYLINEMYNERVAKDGINNSAIAYRNNLDKNNNIHFAKIAFDKMKELEDCYVIIGDFTSFFDKLDHSYLKERLCDLLQVDKLSDDYYAVYRNITKFSTWELSDLLQENGLTNTSYGIKQFNQQERALSLGKFKEMKPEKIYRHKESYGIPQGSSISAALSNIYMLEFDNKINSYVSSRSGLYMRYSDDFIVIIPKDKSDGLNKESDILMSIVKSTPSLELEPNKTQLFEFNNGNINAFEIREQALVPIKKNRIDYLGFSFDGLFVTIRDKTVSKYYNKLNRSLKKIVNNKFDTKTKKIIKSIRLYKRYGYQKNKEKRNFMSYVNRAETIYKHTERVNIVRKRHIQKIRRKLKSITD